MIYCFLLYEKQVINSLEIKEKGGTSTLEKIESSFYAGETIIII